MKAVGDTVARHDGRVFSTAGDAVLAEFSSPVNALRASMEARNAIAAVPGATARDMRFGLHVADVVVVGRRPSRRRRERRSTSAVGRRSGRYRRHEGGLRSRPPCLPLWLRAARRTEFQGHIGAGPGIPGRRNCRPPSLPVGPHPGCATLADAAQLRRGRAVFHGIVAGPGPACSLLRG